MKFYSCPVCGSQNVQRLPLVYEAGTAFFSGSVHLSAASLARHGPGVISGTEQTRLAARAAPPEKETIFGHVILLWMFFALAGSPTDSSDSLVGFIVLIGLVAVPLLLRSVVKRVYFNWAVFPKRYAEWKASWVCHKCGHVGPLS